MKQPEQPNEPFYPISKLYLFPRYDRRSWEKAHGRQAPPYDPNRRPKYWADPEAAQRSDANGQVEYDYFDFGAREFRKLSLSVNEAETPNLPGRYVYPKYEPAPTPAVVMNPGGSTSPINPVMLASRDEAEALAAELDADAVLEQDQFAGAFRIDWSGETRRIFMLRIGGQLYNAGLLLARKNRHGVGAPGEWTRGSSGQPIWIPKPQETGEDDRRPEVPMPIRPLLENEQLYLGNPFKVIVYRTDMDSEYNRPQDTVGFPPDVLTLLERIDSNIQQLLLLAMTERP